MNPTFIESLACYFGNEYILGSKDYENADLDDCGVDAPDECEVCGEKAPCSWQDDDGDSIAVCAPCVKLAQERRARRNPRQVDCDHAEDGGRFCPDCGMSLDKETRRKDTALFWARWSSENGDQDGPHDYGLD